MLFIYISSLSSLTAQSFLKVSVLRALFTFILCGLRLLLYLNLLSPILLPLLPFFISCSHALSGCGALIYATLSLSTFYVQAQP